MENLENNKLIADFMGLKPNRHNQDPLHPTDFAEYGGKFIKYSDMEYHTSWDWLMPVVEKCRNESNAEDNHWETIYYSLEGCDIDVTYQAVIEFIENKNK